MAAYERFVGELSRSELEGFFLLDGAVLNLIAHKRADHHKIGMGLQIGTVRFLGAFPDRGSARRAVVGGGVPGRPVGDRGSVGGEIAAAKQRGVYTGRKPALTTEQAQQLRERAAVGERKSALAREFGISRETVYNYLRSAAVTG
ncbi:hypothetical protein Areg01_74400 [Actinoplanes regularis]|nr:hypothetical protein Areg01_74400 [Actinoplanes regularis]